MNAGDATLGDVRWTFLRPLNSAIVEVEVAAGYLGGRRVLVACPAASRRLRNSFVLPRNSYRHADRGLAECRTRQDVDDEHRQGAAARLPRREFQSSKDSMQTGARPPADLAIGAFMSALQNWLLSAVKSSGAVSPGHSRDCEQDSGNHTASDGLQGDLEDHFPHRRAKGHCGLAQAARRAGACSVVRTTTGSQLTRGQRSCPSEKCPTCATYTVVTKSPMTIDGAESRMSLMKRVTRAIQPFFPYWRDRSRRECRSACWMNVATKTIMTLP